MRHTRPGERDRRTPLAPAGCGADLPALHSCREDPFAPPTGSLSTATMRPIELVSCPTGLRAWVARSYSLTREILGDPARFATCGAFAHVLPLIPIGRAVRPGDFERMDGQEHRQIRGTLASELMGTAALAAQQDWIHALVEKRVSALITAGPPAELYEAFAWPVAARIATEYLGLPATISTLFHRKAALVSSASAGESELKSAVFAFSMSLRKALRRPPSAASGPGLLERLAWRQGDAALTEEELMGIASGVLMGHYSLANMVTFATAALLGQPGQWEALVHDPALVPRAVEELVRYLAVPEGVLRQATRDTTLGDQRLRHGDLVIAAIGSANRDPALCAEPDDLRVGRGPVAHLGFGHGPHYCIGHKFARLELSAILRELVTRIPSLRLASAELVFRTDSTLGGPGLLPVSWTATRPSPGR